MAWKDKAHKFTTRAEREAEQAIRVAAALRTSEIEDAQVAAGLKEVSVNQAEDWIDGQLDGATTIAQLRETTRTILKKMVPYILK